jgi:CO/xanthine dehydrogenase Mo-binding subunit
VRNTDDRDAAKHDAGKSSSVLARREFLKTTGAVVVGITAAQRPRAQAQNAGAAAWERGVKSGPPDPAAIDSYLAVHPNNTATIFIGYVDLGQGGPTALSQIAAEELDLEFSQVAFDRADTFISTNGSTLASRTAGIGGTEMRVAAAEARRVLLELASERLKAPVQDLTVAKGVVSVRRDPQKSVTYGELLGNKPFDRKFEAVAYSAGAELPRKSRDVAPFKSRAEYKVVGTRVPRTDMPDKVSGTYQYMQHVRVPGMLHGRVVWPQGQMAGGVTPPKVVSVDEQSIRHIPGVRIIRRNNFIGVVAEHEWDAVRASRQLKVTWEPFPAVFPGHEGIHDNFRAAQTNDLVIVNEGDAAGVLTQPPAGVRVASASYRGPYEGHGPMAPNCAVADITRDGALVMCSSQSIYQTRGSVSRVTGLPVEKIRVQYFAGSNTYGSSCYTDAAEAAAILSKEAGKPVRLQLSRLDEHGWDNYGPAHLAEMRGAIDANGKILAFEYQAWGHDGNGVGTASQLLAMEGPAVGGPGFAAPVNDGQRGAAPAGGRGGGRGGGQPGIGGLYQVRISQNDMYDTPNRRMVEHRVPGRGYLKLGALRAPLDPPYFFAQEGMMDELAYLAKLDPWEFRKRNISHPRWLGVLKAAAEAAKWTPRVAASSVTGAKIAVGRGIALGTHHLIPNQGDRITFAAAVVEIEVNKETGVVVAKHVYGAMDCGLAINPGIVESQIVGMSVHGTSLALKEEVRFSQTNVTSLDWNSYPTLRFGEHPMVTPIVVQQINEKSSGAGEEVLPAVVGAIGNAFFDATGVRLRQFPLTPQRVLAALKAAPTTPNRTA